MSAMDANFDCMSADKYSATNIIYAFNNMPGVGGITQQDIKRTITIDIESMELRVIRLPRLRCRIHILSIRME